MTRAKTSPPMHKPVFDAAGILRFAALETSVTSHDRRDTAGDPDRARITLSLKHDVVTRLKAEADRKEKTVAQIVEKLVSKHLGKH